MGAFTFTADAGTDTLTITAHGLLTGDGPVAVRNIGGALPAATPALGPVLDRWVIRVDANTLKIATSNANAMSGTFIDITSDGTGTNILEIGLPYRRARTYANGSILFPADLNAMMDSHVAIYDLLTGQPQTLWNALTLTHPITLTATLTPSGGIRRPVHVSAANAQLTSIGLGGPAIFDGSVWSLGTSGAAQGPVFDVPLNAGDILTAVRVYVIKTSASGTISAVFTVRNTATGATVCSGNASLSVNNPGNVTMTLSTIAVGSLPFTILDGHSMTVAVSGGGTTGDQVRGVAGYF